MSRQIMVCFVRSDSSVLQESWLNSAASWFAGGNSQGSAPYIHAELLFIPKANALSTKSEVYGTACSIVYNNVVHLEKKRFSRKEWVFRSMECSEDQYNKMYHFCKKHKGESFNHLGYFMYWSGLLAPKPTFYTWFGMYPRWYCSEIVIAALQHGDIIDKTLSVSTHPNELYKIIKNKSMADCGRNMTQVKLQFV